VTDPSPDFIAVYPDAAPPALCRQIIDKFEASGQAVRGRTGSGVDLTLKNSFDIAISGRPEWAAEGQFLQQVLMTGLLQYLRAYPHLLVGALALRVPDPATGQLRQTTAADVAGMPDDALRGYVGRVLRPGNVNLQKYLAGEGGYPHWHSEIYPQDGRCEPLHRVLLWSVYLNDVPQAGETEFLYQHRKIAPREGTLLIAPAGFTHTHRGNTPVGGDKYIATSWVLFQRSEQLFGK
jgi:hypothetical protein